MVTLRRVREFWQEHPVFSYELGEPGTPRFYRALDALKRRDVECFTAAYWNFAAFAGRRVLEVGCGPGWYTVNYARAGAQVWAVDLTPKALELTRRHLARAGLAAGLVQGNAEALPFAEGSFDLVVACGVLHHTPHPLQAMRECLRVVRPGGRGKITLYRRGILLHPRVFPLTRLVMRLAGASRPETNMARAARSAEEFVRLYDGPDNPLGVALGDRAWRRMLEEAGWRVVSVQAHYFPRRFLPFGNLLPHWVHHLLDRLFGTMVYFRLQRPDDPGPGGQGIEGDDRERQ